MASHVYRAFGLTIESDFALPGIPELDDPCEPRVTLSLVRPNELERAWSGTDQPPVWRTVLSDGLPLEHEMGKGGDHRFRYGSAAFHLSADSRTLLCAPEDPADPGWQRQLLDTILFSASFANGFELLHASAVEHETGVLAFVAVSGGGKSSLAAELVRRGLPLFCDDVLAIAPAGEGLECFPGPPIMNLPHAGAPAHELGDVIADFPREHEAWVAVRGAATSPLPLAAVYLLDRTADDADLVPSPGRPLLELLAHAIGLPHDFSRARRRFDVFSRVASETPVWRLEASPSTTPADLADLVEQSVAEAGDALMAVAR